MLDLKQVVLDIIKNKKLDADAVNDLKKEFAKKYGLSDVPSNVQLLQTYHDLVKHGSIKKNIFLEQALKKRAIRSQSGIVAVQVLTKPWPCPGKCIFCPNDPTMPKSYIKTEPGAMRALLNKFDPINQVYNRLSSLTSTGHQTDKIEMIVLGGTFDSYVREYKIKFVKALYDACNTFSQLKIKNKEITINDEKIEKHGRKRFHYEITNLKQIKYPKTIQESMKKNESAENRIIGLTIETRPEFVTDANCKFWRELGVTRVEMGIQSMYDEVLQANKRGHSVQASELACHKLRQYGFKFCVHIMPGLYKSDYRKDLGTFVKIYSNISIKPDEIKFYPTSVIPNTELFNLYQKVEYKPLTTKMIQKLIRQTFLEVIPPYTRIKRLIRDIPATEIAAGSHVTNLSQLVHHQMERELKDWDTKQLKAFYGRLYGNYSLFSSLDECLEFELLIDKLKDIEIQSYIVGEEPDLKSYRNFVSLDTRSREIRHKTNENKTRNKDKVNLIIRKYKSSVGVEYFISFEDKLGYLYGFARLLLSDHAMVRELHVYGNVEMIKSVDSEQGTVNSKKVQHTGFGKQLMHVAEKISKMHHYKKLSVISGVGVREYYGKLGYKLVGTYMVKGL